MGEKYSNIDVKYLGATDEREELPSYHAGEGLSIEDLLQTYYSMTGEDGGI